MGFYDCRQVSHGASSGVGMNHSDHEHSLAEEKAKARIRDGFKSKKPKSHVWPCVHTQTEQSWYVSVFSCPVHAFHEANTKYEREIITL